MYGMPREQEVHYLRCLADLMRSYSMEIVEPDDPGEPARIHVRYETRPRDIVIAPGRDRWMYYAWLNADGTTEPVEPLTNRWNAARTILRTINPLTTRSPCV